MIEVSNLSKIFRVFEKEPGLAGSLKSLFNRRWVDKHALKNVSMRVEAGEIVGLVGANGAGKTTLVKIMSGIVYPTSGTCRVLGFTPSERKNEFRSQIALIMGQKPQLWWDLPAADCFILLREIYKVDAKVHQQRLDELTHALSATHVLKTPLRRLSLGERMKMELIAALLHEPKVIFLDEPTIGLDLNSQHAIRTFLLDYRKRHNPAIILTSHYMDDIQELCDRILIIREGEFVYDGKLAALSADYLAYKIVVVSFSGEAHPSILPRNIEVLEQEADRWRLRVPREALPELVKTIMGSLNVSDLAIEGDDIARVISNVMDARHP